MKRSALVTLFKSESGGEIARLRDLDSPVTKDGQRRSGWRWQRLLRRIRKHYPVLAVIILPTLLASIYFFLWASDQYVSEASFVVRSSQGSGIGGSSALLGLMMGSGVGMHAAQDELESVNDYIISHDAVRALQAKLDLIKIFRSPNADLLTRLWWSAPSAEDLLDYYQGKVTVVFDSSTGISTLRVRAFRPEDAKRIADALLELSEGLVNRFSERSQADSTRVAKDEVARAEARVAAVREKLTAFRDRERSIDPGKSSAMVLELMSKLETQLAQTRAEITESSTYLKPDNAKYVMLRNKADALENQIATEKRRLTGSDGALAPVVAAYERLLMEREFADKGYASALLSLEAARVDAAKQHLYLVSIVEPNMPEKALYPKRVIIVATVLFGSLMAYGIGWLILAGVREHAA